MDEVIANKNKISGNNSSLSGNVGMAPASSNVIS